MLKTIIVKGLKKVLNTKKDILKYMAGYAAVLVPFFIAADHHGVVERRTVFVRPGEYKGDAER